MRDSTPRRQTLLVFLLFLTLYLLTASGHLSTPDEELMFRTTEALATRGALSIEPLIDATGSGFASRRGLSGREYAQYGLGNSLFAVPLFWAGSALAALIPPETAEQWLDFRTTLLLPEDAERGPALVKRLVVSLQGSLVTAALCALVWRFARRVALHVQSGLSPIAASSSPAGTSSSRSPASLPLSPDGAAWLTALAFGAGTMAWPHARTFFSEPLAALFMLGAFYVAGGGDGSPSARRALASGFLFALALLTRLDSFFLLPGLGLLLALRHLESGEEGGPVFVGTAQEGLRRLVSRKFLLVALAAAFPLAAVIAYQLILNKVLFGGATESAYADQTEGIRFSTPLLAGLYGFLFSVGKSAFLFSPALVLGLAGWRVLGRRDPSLALSLGAAVLMGLLLHARWQNWSGGWDWGPRHIHQLHAFAMVPAAALFAAGWSRLTRLAYAAIMIPAAAVQVYGTSQHPVEFYTLYYRLPLLRPEPRLPMATALYSPGEAVPLVHRLGMVDPATGQKKPDAFWPLPAPINDSIYVPQNSVWYRYAEMWDLGYTDNLWLRLWRRAQGREREIR